ncbi:MAG TPA: PrgI family protein [Candidatus Paceibacterota bacterium]|nr:PrgI family protein [Candidatus Paceibacterota bacterium]
MQFQVPQFIEVEDKVIGPFTFRQFLYLAGGTGLSVVAYRLLPIYMAALIILPVAALALALAFYRVNDKPFIEVLEAAFTYATKSKLYLWKKQPPKPQETAAKVTEGPVVGPKLSESKLKELAWSLDVNEKLNRR